MVSVAEELVDFFACVGTWSCYHLAFNFLGYFFFSWWIGGRRLAGFGIEAGLEDCGVAGERVHSLERGAVSMQMYRRAGTTGYCE